jgi:hypothetical protein
VIGTSTAQQRYLERESGAPSRRTTSANPPRRARHGLAAQPSRRARRRGARRWSGFSTTA